MNNFDLSIAHSFPIESISSHNFLDLFDYHVKSTPNCTALVFDSEEISYKKLAERIDDVASILIANGVKRTDRIVISLERGPNLVIAMLATLKVGGIFIPIDPRYPEERKAFMLADSKPSYVISSTEIFESTSTLHNTDSKNSLDLNGLDPAYIIYTSGSTGKPKGAINTHQGLLNLAKEQIRLFGISSQSRVLQFASFSFDASVSEIVMTLGAGATLVLPQQEQVIPGPAFIKLLRDSRVTHITLPPSILATLLDIDLPDMKCIVVAGEPCPLELARTWAKKCTFINAYGVSEAAVCSAVKVFQPSMASLPIGKAMNGIDLQVMNDDGTPVSVGESGELYIGGLGVGLGYLDRPELTKEKFVTLSTQSKEATRYYRTGDKVKLLLDGSLEYLGRFDNQVKVRGFRIELDEINSVVESHTGIIQSAVVVRTDPKLGASIAAFYKIDPSEKTAPTSRELRQFLASKLPAHMIPSYLIKVEDFPLSPSGKVDLAKLRTISIEQNANLQPNDLPTNLTEEALVELCSELLHGDAVPLTQSFIDLGGDSLLAVRLAIKLEGRFSISISEADILQAKNLKELALHIELQKVLELPKLTIVPRTGPVDPTPPQAIFGLLEELKVDTSPLNCCAAFELEGDVDVDLLQSAYKKLYDRHEGLRLKFPTVDNKFKLWVHENFNPIIEYRDLSQSADPAKELQRYYEYSERIRFDIKNDLLVKCFLLKLTPNRHIFSLIAHHAIFDAWSLHIFTQDLFALMTEIKTGKVFLKPLNIQFLDYVDWLHKTLALRNNKAIDSYLSKVFALPRPLFDLNKRKERPAIKSGLGTNSFIKLSKSETARLYNFCAQNKLTPFMVCCAVMKAVLFKHSDQPDITAGGPVSIRYHQDLENQIGLYGSAYVLRTILNSKESMISLFSRTKSNLLEAYKYPVYSIGEVLQKFGFEMDLSRTAPYDISIASHMFDLKLYDQQFADILGLSLKPIPVPLTTGFFDFEITFHLFNGEIELEIRSDAAIYEKSTIDALTKDFHSLAQLTLDTPTSTLQSLLSKI